ncbi:MAG TPA: superoxide dismutase family protein [Clostridiales bacterium]|jgi:Cu-Zn family superoxide dismutase|nr:superoxide dismutase family protein [Clostridiales bacterium]HCG35170.1 superoxide dismutase family protein [Clostridiales bacterium]
MVNNLLTTRGILHHIATRRPDAHADIYGSPAFPNIRGNAWFWQTHTGVYVCVTAQNLPYQSEENPYNVLGTHIHEGSSCTGNINDPFANAGAHYNPYQQAHPYHAGDLPPLFVNEGYAWNVVMTDRFVVDEIIGMTIIIHSQADDFHTQPSGESGSRIACGYIHRQR